MSSQLNGSYFMPLNGKSDTSKEESGSSCMFTTPKVTYSKDTQDFVKLLIDESRLTNVQKNSFESILRSGSALPKSPTEIVNNGRRVLFKKRHTERARALGISLDDSEEVYRGPNRFFLPPGGRRSLETISASGDLRLDSNHIRKYHPVDKEKEKERFAHKMSYGTDLPTDSKAAGQKVTRSVTPRVINVDMLKEQRCEELVDEIEERVEFLRSMEKLGRDKQHKTTIVVQIKEKLNEIKKLGNASQAQEIIENLQLEKIDKSFQPGQTHFKNILCLDE